MIVGGVLFEFVTGILNIQNYYIFPFSFYTAHLYGGWVFIAGLVVHVTLKFRRMRAGLRSRSLRRELRTPLAGTRPRPGPRSLRACGHPAAADALAARAAGRGRRRVAHRWPAWWRASRSAAGPADRAARPPRTVRRPVGRLPVNRTAAGRPDRRGRGERLPARDHRAPGRWRLPASKSWRCRSTVAVLPIACVEGWSYAASWTGVRLADLARLAGIAVPAPPVWSPSRRAARSATPRCRRRR